ncbi:ATP-binding protein [Pseudoflavonifractor phocaeensis]|uniref:ATP-binding protein n=1 Tax=Pseudoflavonifractor phocaeensis TaxID=1870988 RepID=UPI00195BBD5F|nr:ATP-binding protein [Pseudoflavonifractor phocaeensis]MBM6870504.1 ATP-binding protein [Pseudoflavonifractor phocaeensis]MBM6938229.1 ATP-binding protein [Pseudoflavonifractor phocaeensis]
MELPLLRCALHGVSAYKHLMDQPVPSLALSLLDHLSAGQGEEALEDYTRLFHTLHREGCPNLGAWLHDALRDQESPYAHMVEHGHTDPVLKDAARRDIDILSALAGLDCDAVLGRMEEILPTQWKPVVESLPRWDCAVPFTFASLTGFYAAHGAGMFARNRAFLWESGQLWPVEQPDSLKPDEMLGYERQRDQVVANTRALLEGRHVNNVLLYGDSGTGKSATVKALLSLPGFDDLRLIEVQKEELADLPDLIRILAGRRRKFILFVDDLAFDQDDRTYSVLKTILEGGLERRPANVAIYATSNRRHLVRQTFSDRAGDEVDASETIQEKTSLSDRFGLRIPYLALNKAEFLDMVERMAAQHGVSMDRDTLRADAVKWEARHPGRTPRTALQFIASLPL